MTTMVMAKMKVCILPTDHLHRPMVCVCVRAYVCVRACVCACVQCVHACVRACDLAQHRLAPQLMVTPAQKSSFYDTHVLVIVG